MNCLLSLIYERFVFVVFMEHLLLLCETLVLLLCETLLPLLFEFCVNVATWTSCYSRIVYVLLLIVLGTL